MKTNLAILATVILVIVGAVWYVRTSDAPQPSPQTSKTMDSLVVTRPAFDSSLVRSGEHRDSISHALTNVDSNLATVDSTANDAQRLADSLAIEEKWQAAYKARDDEASALRVQVDLERDKIALLEADTISLRQDLRSTIARLNVSEELNARWQRDFVTKTTCRIGPIPCPTRTQSLVGGLLLGAIAASRR